MALPRSVLVTDNIYDAFETTDYSNHFLVQVIKLMKFLKRKTFYDYDQDLLMISLISQTKVAHKNGV